MPDYAPNYSPRYVMRYRHGSANHNQTVRVPRGATRADAGVTSKLAVMWSTQVTRMFTDFLPLDMTYYAEDTFIGLPVDLGDLAEVSGTLGATPDPLYSAIQLRLELKGNAGGLGSISFFGLNMVDIDGAGAFRDFRVYAAEDALVASLITAASELSPAFVPMGSTTSVVRPYANLKFNDYWVGQLRA